jgi:hypothetical protein
MGNSGDPGDPWPGSTNNREFHDRSVPNSKDYMDSSSQVAVWEISSSDSVMTANLDIIWSRPYFVVYSYAFQDEDDDGVLEAGETVQVFFQLRNWWLDANDVYLTMTSGNPDIVFTSGTIYKNKLWGDGAVQIITDPIEFILPDTITPTYDSFFIQIESDGGQFSADFGIEMQVGESQILIVDDDRGASYDTLYANDVYRRKIPADLWNKKIKGSPPSTELNKYNMVFWFTGDTNSNYFTSADIDAMKTYMDNGGSFFLTGQGIAGQLNSQDSDFLNNYLRCEFVQRPIFMPYEAGIPGSPIGEGLTLYHFSGSNAEFTWGEEILPVDGAVPAFKYSFTEAITSLSYSGIYKLVFFDFSYESVNPHSGPGNPRDTVMYNILNFFGRQMTDVADDDYSFVLPKGFELQQNYPNPFNPVTTINYTVRYAGGGSLPNTVIRVFNVLGQEIKTLIDEPQMPGTYSVRWDGTNSRGEPAGSGIYFYQIKRGNDFESKKMVLLK